MTIHKLAVLALVAAALAAPDLADARPGGGSVSGGHSVGAAHYGGGWGGHHGGYYGGHYGHYGHYGWGYGGWGPYFWGGVGIGLGVGAVAYAYSDPWYPYGYPGYYPVYSAAPVVESVVVEPQPGDRVVRSGRPVPAASHAPEPIFYPKNGQPPERIEADRRDCNRWATTQAGAMSDASIFQRATFACMEGRGYTVR